ncbi:hypothetical protein [Parasphingopyxis sp.]|uniref:hypothetical protein n=1 Tax=Parasphingopyxis sp. TaxID=1920299 RepID=UPI00261ACF8B|nr:hypothetical protein [Parasphingopyxis sp.]
MTRPVLIFGLAALVRALAVRAGDRPVVDTISAKPWSSITFTGMRHRFALTFAGEHAADTVNRLSQNLDYAEFDLGRCILVDIAIVESDIDDDQARIELEALILAND